MADRARVSNELLMPMGDRQAERGSTAKQAEPANSEAAKDKAKPAGAHVSSQSETDQSKAAARIPSDAAKVINALGKAIDTAGAKMPADQGSNENQTGGQHQQTENK